MVGSKTSQGTFFYFIRISITSLIKPPEGNYNLEWNTPRRIILLKAGHVESLHTNRLAFITLSTHVLSEILMK